MKPLTNETLIEFRKKFPHKIAEVIDDFGSTTKTDIEAFILSALQAKEQSVKKETLDEVLKACQIANDNMVGDDPMSICSSDFEVIKKILSNLSEK